MYAKRPPKKSACNYTTVKEMVAREGDGIVGVTNAFLLAIKGVIWSVKDPDTDVQTPIPIATDLMRMFIVNHATTDDMRMTSGKWAGTTGSAKAKGRNEGQGTAMKQVYSSSGTIVLCLVICHTSRAQRLSSKKVINEGQQQHCVRFESCFHVLFHGFCTCT